MIIYIISQNIKALVNQWISFFCLDQSLGPKPKPEHNFYKLYFFFRLYPVRLHVDLCNVPGHALTHKSEALGSKNNLFSQFWSMVHSLYWTVRNVAISDACSPAKYLLPNESNNSQWGTGILNCCLWPPGSPTNCNQLWLGSYRGQRWPGDWKEVLEQLNR